jgi:hypothetical protein
MTTEEKREAFASLSRNPGIYTGQEYAESLTAKDPMQVGDRVAWTVDDEPGTIVALTDRAIAIEWDSSGIEWYSCSSGAIERIKPVTQHFSCRFKR